MNIFEKHVTKQTLERDAREYQEDARNFAADAAYYLENGVEETAKYCQQRAHKYAAVARGVVAYLAAAA